MQIFLSHSSNDKQIVKRIKDDLSSYGYKIWIDEEAIPFGGSIVEHVEKGLKDSNLLLVFLSKNSVLSKWIQNEWQVQFFKQVNESKTNILPILLDDCDIPNFLSHIKYLDFRQRDLYEDNLSILLDALNRLKVENEIELAPLKKNKGNYSILDNTIEILEELEKEYIALPVYKRLPIIEILKKIPRSGKQIRLNNFIPKVKIRTIYDHLLSLAHTADCLLPYIKHGISKEDIDELPRCIAFHELNEVVLGDIPTYTPLTPEKRILSRVYAEERLRNVMSKKRKQISNDFIWLFLNEKNRRSLEKVNKTLANNKSSIYITFKLLDKIDPIIATWRYLHEYRGKLGETPRDFNHKMKDFFENPDIKTFVTNNAVDSKVLDLISFLQDRTNAWEYYEDSNKIFNSNDSFSLPKDVIKKIIEGIPLFTTSDLKHI
jgi:5'-deoxynucleotidase YfbR-like HD superfamily hydrolase